MNTSRTPIHAQEYWLTMMLPDCICETVNLQSQARQYGVTTDFSILFNINRTDCTSQYSHIAKVCAYLFAEVVLHLTIHVPS